MAPKPVLLCFLVGSVSLGSCTRPSEPEEKVKAETDRCPQTYEFGNYGCAEIFGLLIAPDGGLARAPGRPASEITVSLTQLSPAPAISSYTLVIRDTSGTYRLRATRYFGPPPAGPDTITVQVRAVWWDAFAAASPEGFLPILAADSVVHQIRLVPVGARFVPDTVHLALRRPQGVAIPEQPGT